IIYADRTTPRRETFAPATLGDHVDGVLVHWERMDDPRDALTRAVDEARAHPPRILPPWDHGGPTLHAVLRTAFYLCQHSRGGTFGRPLTRMPARLGHPKAVVARAIQRAVDTGAFRPVNRKASNLWRRDKHGRLVPPRCRTFRLNPGVVEPPAGEEEDTP